ncbi:TetR family transcriptional regulator [Streptomyces sp. NPDC045456]|uniref:TetR family transcriptional regulator n=1 Tax=Streptomyces sp. NPDC045456 TaxID=3155254 RepID=UPI0033DA7057
MATRHTILTAAAEVIIERGYGGASISQITARAGVAAGAVYFHFRSKEGLAHALLGLDLLDGLPRAAAQLCRSGATTPCCWPAASTRIRRSGPRRTWPRSPTIRTAGRHPGPPGGPRWPGPLTGQQAHDGLLVADALAGHLLAWHPGTGASAGGTGAAGAVELHRAEVHQATGVLSARHRISMDEALVRLRAQAFAAGQTITGLARDILRELPP